MRSLKPQVVLVILAGMLAACSSTTPKAATEDPFAQYVWPPPPDEPRIRLVTILQSRADVEASSRLSRTLFGASPQSPFDSLQKPFAVDYDAQGRILVTDPGAGALFRFDLKGRRLDVFGTSGSLRLKSPLGLGIGPDGTIYIADVGIRKVVAFDAEGKVKGAYGRAGELDNPADAAVSPDGKKLFVADSKLHRVVIFEIPSGKLLSSFGGRGEKEGEFAFPTSLAFDKRGSLFVVDQINTRVQVFTQDGEFVDQLGALGVGFGNFVRPKDVAVDDAGLIYVTDATFNNVQIFSPDLRLLTFVGDGGTRPGQFQIASGVAVHGNEFAVVDQLGHRVQVFRFIAPKTAK